MRHNYDIELSDEIKQLILIDYINNQLSLLDLVKKYNVKSKYFLTKLIGKNIRTAGDASKLAHKKYPNVFKHSDETKLKMREKRLAFMKEHPEQTAWRTCRKNLSYPEKCFLKYIYDRGLDKKHEIVREKSFFPYFVDFAFVDIHLAVEIDGSQHEDIERKNSDIKKDELLHSLGWNVVRFTAKCVQNDWSEIDKIFDRNFDVVEETISVGVKYKPKKYQKVERESNGRTKKQNEASFRQRKCIRPSKEKLEKLLLESNFSAIGRMFGVSDNAIRRWCKFYGIEPIRKNK